MIKGGSFMSADELNIQQYKKMTETPIPKLILGLAAATGEKDRTAHAARFVRYGQTAKPDAQRHAYYEKQFALYKELRDFEVRHARG